ncbi:MAG: chorismate-binding protein [Holophagales bacterium]|nr:MAG: chorismate-binding protein [Holophagales bacterium]
MIREPAGALPRGVPRMAWVRAPERGWWRFASPVGGCVAQEADAVPGTLAAVEEACERGLWAVGSVEYEAAPGFDRALAVRSRTENRALAGFAFFEPPEELATLPPPGSAEPWVSRLDPDLGAADHASALGTIHEAIARGETYQVNFTFALRGRCGTTAEELFFALAPAAEAPLALFLDLGDRAVVSLSPELFFERDGELLRMRPMKGTRRRGRWREEDEALAVELASAEKDRAENLMIVDMVRNDLGRVARAGTVRVTRLFDVERYPTVWQMTSTVEATSRAPLPELFAALFPCASVTGAPKASTMGWIARLEREPRGVYCGALGWVAPGGRARFGVGIRTADVEAASGDLVYRVGSGVVWDSAPAAEYAECLAKGRALSTDPCPVELFETLRLGRDRRLARVELHLARLAASAERFGLPCDRQLAREVLAEHVTRLPPERSRRRVRLTLAPDGAFAVTSEPIASARRPWIAALVGAPVESADLLLFHKTTRRERYDRALAEARACGADEAILRNERGELTEGCRTNLLLRVGGRWLTPRREAGLLPGVARERLLRTGRVAESTLTVTDLAAAESVLLINSLRGAIRVAAVHAAAAEGDRLLWGSSENVAPVTEER